VVRAISDRAGDGGADADIVGLTDPDGNASLSAAARYLLRRPGALPRLVRLARGSKLASERAVGAAIKAAKS
jgi:adenosylhomocysteine nucleosidase